MRNVSLLVFAQVASGVVGVASAKLFLNDSLSVEVYGWIIVISGVVNVVALVALALELNRRRVDKKQKQAGPL